MGFGTHTPAHIPLQYRKVLTPKLCYFANESESVWSHPETRDFLSDLDYYAGRALRASSPSQALDEYLADTFTPQLAMASGYTNSVSTFHFLHTALERIDCAACAGDRPICRETALESDAANVTLSGLCMEPLHRLFRLSLRTSEHFYQKYAPFAIRKVHFNSEASSDERLHDIPVPYMVNGRTELYDDCSTVVLILNGERFDRDSFLAILYVLFHECICHAFQWSIRPGTSARQPCGNDDYFGEGWMAFLAWSILYDLLDGQISDLVSERAQIPQNRRLLHVCRNFHQERSNPGAQNPCEMSRVHLFGERIAEVVRSFLLELDVPEPQEVFYHLSFAFNAAGTTRKARNAFVESLVELQDLYYFTSGPRPAPPRLSRIFREFADKRHLQTFLEQLLPQELIKDCIFI
jgi:hypothetical protein